MNAATALQNDARRLEFNVGKVVVVVFPHPQGCRTYVIAASGGDAMIVDPHLDLVDAVAAAVRGRGWTPRYVVDTHTHADHPSGAAALAAQFGAARVAHRAGGHAGVAIHPEDGAALRLGDVDVRVRHAPGHTPDHLVLLADGALFSGDSLFLGAVARTDFLGGDAGKLFDSLGALLRELPDATLVFPGHDYKGETSGTIGIERAKNPWLAISDRATFVRGLTANPPPRPANMDDLLRLNREGSPIPAEISASDAVKRVKAGGAGSVIDVRTAAEVETEHVAGSRHIPLDRIRDSAEAVRATPAPRLLLCAKGARATSARKILTESGIAGLTVVTGGIEAFREAGGPVVRGRKRMSLERQVRIAAGALTVIGVVLSWTVHEVFIGLTLFVGCGLIFAGVTDRCGMALMLAKMPWNRSGASGLSAGTAAAGCAASAPPSACAASAPPPSCAAAPPSAAAKQS